MNRSVDIASIARDPAWLPHRYDPGHDAVHFVRTPREVHRAATFLTDDHLPEAGNPIVIRREDAIAARPASAPIHFIFHSAFCCSTLLARAFDIEGLSMGLKEPVILNDLVGWRQRGGERREIARALDHTLALLARPFAAGEVVVVKPSNVVNGLAPVMLAMRPGAQALLLHAPLKTYLGSIAKKGMWGRLWVRDLFVKLLKEGLIDLGFANEEYLGHTDLQAAAVGWIAQQALFARLAEAHPGRVRTLDSETLVARPAEVMTALATLFGLTLDRNAIDRIVAGPVFTRHSKLDADFGGEQRAAEHRDAAEAHAEEIDRVTAWAEAVAKRTGIPLILPAPLLDHRSSPERLT